MVQLSTPGVTPNRGMGSPWGTFCQITLTSCWFYWDQLMFEYYILMNYSYLYLTSALSPRHAAPHWRRTQSNEITGATTNQPSDSCPRPVTVYTLHRSGRPSRSTTEDREDTPTPHTARYRPTNLWDALKTGARRNTGDLHQSIANQMWLLLPLHTRCYQTSQRNKHYIKQMQFTNKSHNLQTHNALCTQPRQSGWDYNLRTE